MTLFDCVLLYLAGAAITLLLQKWWNAYNIKRYGYPLFGFQWWSYFVFVLVWPILLFFLLMEIKRDYNASL